MNRHTRPRPACVHHHQELRWAGFIGAEFSTATSWAPGRRAGEIISPGIRAGAENPPVRLLALLPVLLFVPRPLSAGDPLDAAAAKLRAHAALSGTFTQESRSTLSGRTTTESGRCILARDGRARFDYDRPAGKLALADGAFFQLYLPADHQLIRQPLSADTAPALIFATPGELRRRFTVTSRPAPDGGLEITLRPKARDAAWIAAVLRLDGRALPLSLTIHDESGAATIFTFTLAPLAAVDPELFSFTPPAGTERIGK